MRPNSSDCAGGHTVVPKSTELREATRSHICGLVNAIRVKETTYKSAGSVHGCALFKGSDMLVFVEDVGRHNALDTIAGWMWPSVWACAPLAGPPTSAFFVIAGWGACYWSPRCLQNLSRV